MNSIFSTVCSLSFVCLTYTTISAISSCGTHSGTTQHIRADSTRTLSSIATKLASLLLHIDCTSIAPPAYAHAVKFHIVALRPPRLHVVVLLTIHRDSLFAVRLALRLAHAKVQDNDNTLPPLCLSTVNEPSLQHTSIYPCALEFLFTYSS